MQIQDSVLQLVLGNKAPLLTRFLGTVRCLSCRDLTNGQCHNCRDIRSASANWIQEALFTPLANFASKRSDLLCTYDLGKLAGVQRHIYCLATHDTEGSWALGP